MPNIFKEIRTSGKIPTYKYLVDGEWQESRNRKMIDIFSPIDNSLLGRIQSVLPREADIAVTAASMAQKSWVSISLEKRKAILNRVIDQVEKNKDILINFLILELGKTRSNAEHEISRISQIIKDYIVSYSEKIEEVKIQDNTWSIKRMPVGVVLCITPFNFPLSTTIGKIIPALIAGNSVILKPSTYGAIGALHLANLFQKAGLPDGVLNVITGKGEQVGRYIAQHSLVNMISFTGSSKVGREIAKKTNMVNQIYELGGKDPAIILADANLEKAAEMVAIGAFLFAGQRCVAIKRVIVEQKVKKQFIEKLVKYTEKHFGIVGDPRDKKTQLGPVISDKQADYLSMLLSDALKKGAKIICGGNRFSVTYRKHRLRRRILEISRRLIRLRKGQGRYFEPTILDNVTPGMKIAWQEQFGPILPVLTVRNDKEALNLANASEYGLDTYIFTKNVKKAEEMADKLEVGQVYINTVSGRASDKIPFTGVKNSGLGTQGLKYSIDAVTCPRVIKK
ncbi:MAG: aldehyde dehydrogenase family protein [Candidatus Berkelbacteria bacterium]|nr:aldehyde dehydrogenase family protein [Candidatus Berkelbacteria bacterium]